MTPGVAGIRMAFGSAAVKYLLIVCAVVGAVTLYLLATASANTTLFAQHYPTLLALNGGLAVCLAALLGYQLYALRRKLKAEQYSQVAEHLSGKLIRSQIVERLQSNGKDRRVR